MHTVILLLFSHFVGDFVFQGNKIATMKYKSLLWLTLHVLAYSGVLTVFSFFIMDTGVILTYVLVNAGLHWVTDFFTSRLNHRLNQLENKHWFWLGIGVDQLIHTICLVYTYEYFVQ